MNIGLINEYFPPHAPGGAEWSTYYLGRHLAEAGHKLVVITPNYGAPKYEECDGMMIHRFWFPQKLERGHLARSILHSNPLFYLYSALQVYRIARREQLQVLHAHNVYSLPGTYLAGRWLSIPSIVTLRDMRSVCVGCLCLHRQEYIPEHCSLLQHWRCMREFDHKYNVGKSRFYRAKWYLNTFIKKLDLPLRNYFLKKVDQIITISDGLKAIYIHAGCLPPERTQTIYNFPPIVPDVPVDFADIRRKYELEGRKIVLAVGKMSFGKGSDVLIAAVPELARSVPDVLVVFVGRKNPLIEVPEDVEAYTKVLGVFPHEEVLKMYAVADVVTMPSVWQEPQGRVLIEAMSLGRPVVATRVGGIPETVDDGMSGMLVERNDPKSLAETITQILLNPELGRWMGENGRSVLDKKFNEQDILRRTLNLYRDVLTKRSLEG
jgi:glycosyltransferase involved in cell wall biosynthesis